MEKRTVRYRLKLATWSVVREAGEPSPRVLNHPQAVALFARDLYRDLDDDKEHFFAVALNVRQRYLFHFHVSTGSQSVAIVHPREVFGPALREGASSVIVIHNHPSGDPTPSPEDHGLTRRLARAGELVGVRLLDHLILGNGLAGKWTSLEERGILNGETPWEEGP